MSTRVILAAVALVATASWSGAFADPAQTGNSAASGAAMLQTNAAAPESNPDQIVCRATPALTGSRLGGGRACLTQREWDLRTKSAQEALVHQQLSGRTSSCGGAMKNSC